MDRLWFYAKGQEKSGPISEAELRALLASGQVAPDDLVWTEGMTNWSRASAVPELGAAPSAPVAPAAAPIAHRTAPTSASPAGVPPGLLGWMSFVGVMNIVYGAFNCLSCVGIVTGIFFILGGFALMSARKLLGELDVVDPRMLPFLGKIKTFVQMTGIMYILGLIVLVIMLIAYAGIIAAALAGAAHLTNTP